MRQALQIVSSLALAGTIMPPILFLVAQIEMGPMKLGMLGATIAWFAATPFWMGRTEVDEERIT